MLGDLKSGVELFRQAWDTIRNRRNPVRAQAARVIQAFEAHGISRVQLPWVLPKDFVIPIDSVGDPDDFKKYVTVELLEWVAEYLALNLSWLIGVTSAPSRLYDEGYKHPERFLDFLRERQNKNPNSQWTLLVLKASSEAIRVGDTEPFSLILQERFAEVNEESVCRYYRCSAGWYVGHSPCVSSLMAHCAIALELGCYVRGLVLDTPLLKKLDSGESLAPELLKSAYGMWHPDDLLPMAGDACIEGFDVLYPDLKIELARLGIN